MLYLFIYNLSAMYCENYARCVQMKTIETTIMELTTHTHIQLKNEKKNAKHDRKQTHREHIKYTPEIDRTKK